ncbi:MAG: Plug domain-containing protein, partial [Gemmatimonadaceae bacterium]|nr:Plug domain-containing protein [Gloeobacterales cyanobacterium ES-bin-141]
MHKLPQLKLSSALALTVLVSACSLWTTAAFGEESLTAALPTGALAAKSQTLSIGEARDLLDVNHNAADLKYRPPLWDWTQPATRKMGQATPPVQEPTTTTPQTPAPPSSVPTEEPASQTTAPDNVGDVLDEVSVTATRRATRQRDTTAVTYTVKKEDFAAQGAATVTDALQLVPGFIAQPALGGVRNAAGVFLRGFDDNRFQVLRDGLSLTRSSNSRNDVSRFAIEDLERIEIVTGGATLRYGSGAVGGVINLITETPKGPPKVTIRYETGTYGFTRYTGKYGGGDDAFSYNLFYTSISAFNDYPYSFTLPNSPVFYGTSTNPDSISPAGDG